MSSTFVEVNSVEKGVKVIVNLDQILEIAPLVSGGSRLFFLDSASVGGTRTFDVTDNYTQFQQFALQTVSAEDVAKKIKALKDKTGGLDIPKL